MTREEAIIILSARSRILKNSKKTGKQHAAEALDMAIEALRQQAERDWIPFGGEATNNLLHRIAEYFREWDGHEPAPTMQVHIDDLRLIAQMNSELCTLREERRKGRWIPCSEGLPKESGSYLATVLCWGEPTVYKKYFTTMGSEPNIWLTNFKVTAWMPVPEPYKGVE